MGQRLIFVHVVVVNFFFKTKTFSTSLKPLYRFYWVFSGWIPAKLNNCYPIFHGIIGNVVQFWPNHKKSSLKLRARNNSHLCQMIYQKYDILDIWFLLNCTYLLQLKKCFTGLISTKMVPLLLLEWSVNWFTFGLFLVYLYISETTGQKSFI